jgi:NNP family nitrate/nitrite transporter-like MFS transporter
MMHFREFWKAGHKPTLVMSFLYFDISFMIWIMMGALSVYISRDFGLTPSQKGLMTAIPILGGALLRIPMGLLSERWGARAAGLLGMALTFIPLVGGWLLSNTLGSVYLFGLLLGFAGASFAVALPLASRWYPPKFQGLAMGIAGAGNSGTLLATLFAPRLAELFGWREVFAIAMIPLAITITLFSLLAKEAPNRPPARPIRDYLAVLREKDALCFCAFYSLTFGGFVGLASFLPLFFFDQYGLDRVRAGDFTTFCVLAGSAFRAVGGHLADRIGGIRLLQILFVAIAAVGVMTMTLPPLAVMTALLFAILMGLGMGNGAVFQLVPQRFGREVGMVTGLVGAAGGFGGFLLPTVLGYLKESSGTYASGLGAFALAAFGCALLLQAVRGNWVGAWVSTTGRAVAASSATPEPAFE